MWWSFLRKLTVNYFLRKAPPQMFDSALNTPLLVCLFAIILFAFYDIIHFILLLAHEKFSKSLNPYQVIVRLMKKQVN